MEIFILFCMIFMHIFDNYYLQGVLAQMKQKSWWVTHCPSPEDAPELYANDYKVALAMHAFSWAFMISLPCVLYLLATGAGVGGAYFFMLLMNAMFHYVVDDMKANWGTINLHTDQTAHLIQVAVTWMICLC